MTAPVVVSVTETAFGSAATSHACALPATVDAGELLLILFTSENDGAVAPTLTGPAGWTEVYNIGEFAANICRTQGCWVTTADGSEDGGTATITTSAAAFGSAQCWRISGATATLSAIEAETGSATVSSAPNPPAITPSGGADDYLVIAVAHCVDDDATVSGNPASYTAGADTQSGGGGNNGATTASAYRRLTGATTENPGAFSLSQSEGARATTIAIPPAAGGAPVQVEIGAGAVTALGQPMGGRLGVSADAAALTAVGGAVGSALAARIAGGTLAIAGRPLSARQAAEIAAAALALAGQGVSPTLASLTGIAAGVLDLTGAQLANPAVVEDLYAIARAILRAIVRRIP